MAFLGINPLYREFLTRQGLREPGSFVDLPGVVVSGHPDRHVVRVNVGEGPSALTAFLKREHRVSWRHRLANACAGFGWVSRSRRETSMLRALSAVGVRAPEWIAAGEDDKNRAFLLVRELTGFVDLRRFLQARRPITRPVRRGTAAALGEAIGRLHAAGYRHGDLYAKHVWIHPATGEVAILDWERSRRVAKWRGRGRWRELAALDATVAPGLASPRDRLAFLKAYALASTPASGGRQPPVPSGKASGRRQPPVWSARRPPCSPVKEGADAPGAPVAKPLLRTAIRNIRREAARLLRRRRVREMRSAAAMEGSQTLIWLDGEALCVTPAFRATLDDPLPAWLARWHQAASNAARVDQVTLPIPFGGRARLVRRWVTRPLAALAGWLRGRPPTSPEVRCAGVLFRLQRHGLRTPELLAVGQRHAFPGRTASFLLTRPREEGVPLTAWLERQRGRPLWTSERKQRWRVLREAGAVWRRLHAAGCVLSRGGVGRSALPLRVESAPDGGPAVALADMSYLQVRRRVPAARRLSELSDLWHSLASGLVSGTDALRFFLAYLEAEHLSPTAKRVARRITRKARRSYREAAR